MKKLALASLFLVLSLSFGWAAGGLRIEIRNHGSYVVRADLSYQNGSVVDTQSTAVTVGVDRTLGDLPPGAKPLALRLTFVSSATAYTIPLDGAKSECPSGSCIIEIEGLWPGPPHYKIKKQD